jgi:uncharacterized protein involved in outer membrane biogenesis
MLVRDFSLDAASLHLDGHGAWEAAGTDPGLDLDVHAASLALPDLATIRSLRLPLADVSARLRLSADDVAVGGTLVAHGLEASLQAGSGAIVADRLSMSLDGGRFAGRFAADTTQKEPAVALQGDFTGVDVLALAPFGFDSGKADIGLDVASSGETEAALLGHVSGTAAIDLHDAHMAGFDLGRVETLLAGHGRPPRAALLQALSQGGSGGFSGALTAQMTQGKIGLADARVSSGDGVVSVSGSYDLPSGAANMSLGVVPAIANPPHYTIKLTGPLHDLKAAPDLGAPRNVHPVKRVLKP